MPPLFAAIYPSPSQQVIQNIRHFGWGIDSIVVVNHQSIETAVAAQLLHRPHVAVCGIERGSDR